MAPSKKALLSAEIDGRRFLYVTNFRSAKVESLRHEIQAGTPNEDAFDDDANSQGLLTVQCSKHRRNDLRHLRKAGCCPARSVGGDGLGFVELFTPSGKHIGACNGATGSMLLGECVDHARLR